MMNARFKQSLIMALVAMHFGLGILTIANRHGTLPFNWLYDLTDPYTKLGFGQGWSMFSKVDARVFFLSYSLKKDGQWTDLKRLDQYFVHRKRNESLKRGEARLEIFFTPALEDVTPGGVSPQSWRAYFYQQAADFFCFGYGKIPGVEAVRFYSSGFTLEEYPGGSMKIEKYPNGESTYGPQAIYEQECTGL